MRSSLLAREARVRLRTTIEALATEHLGDGAGARDPKRALSGSLYRFFALLAAEMARDLAGPVPVSTNAAAFLSDISSGRDLLRRSAGHPHTEIVVGPHPRTYAGGPYRERELGQSHRHRGGQNDPVGADLSAVDLARELAMLPASPQQILSAVYEEILRYQPVLDDDGHIRLELSRAQRRAGGIFYTPQPVARLVVDAALTPLNGKVPCGGLRVLDPAMGAGVFLLEVVRRLADDGDAAHIAEECIFGLDRDPLAVELAILSLWLETGARPDVLARHIGCGDFLAGDRPRERYDVVVGNPPWGAMFAPPEAATLRRSFPGLNGSFDSFKLFLDRAVASTSGTVGMILPQAVLAQTAHADIRGRLLTRLDPYCGIHLGNQVFRAAAPACVLIFGPKPGPASVRVADVRNTATGWRSVPRARWSAEGFPVAGHDTLDLLERLTQRHPTLNSLAPLYRVRDVGLNYSHASVARRSLYRSAQPEDPRDMPRYRGRNFGRYTPVARDGWLRHDILQRLEPGERVSLDWNLRHMAKKVVLRQTSDRITATLDTTGMVMGRSVLAIVGQEEADLLALLACLNSSLLTALYRALADEEGRILPQVKVARLNSLPIPVACLSESADTAEWAALGRMAGELLGRHGGDDDLNDRIDRAVYRLYRLRPDEMAIVQSGCCSYHFPYSRKDGAGMMDRHTCCTPECQHA